MADITLYILEGADPGASLVESEAIGAKSVDVPTLFAGNSVVVRVARVDGDGNITATSGVDIKLAIGQPGSVDVTEDTWSEETGPAGFEATLDLSTAFSSAITAALTAGADYIERTLQINEYTTGRVATVVYMPVKIQASLITA